MTDYDYELIVIGAGPGGYTSALKAANLGNKVAIIEKEDIGGTCLNTGCIPTKSFLQTSKFYGDIRKAEDKKMFNFRIKESDLMEQTTSEEKRMESHLTLNYEKVIEKKDEIVSNLKKGIVQLLVASNIDVYIGNGKIVSPHQVEILKEDEIKYITTRNIIIATGASSNIPSNITIHNQGVHTSYTIVNEKRLFSSIVIIGGGVIGVEYATIYSELGCTVTILEYCERILMGFDKEIASTIASNLRKKGVHIITKGKVIEIGEEILYEKDGKIRTVKGEGVLIATGRTPYTQGLFGNDVMVKMEDNRIKVNDSYQTSIENIYAIGDVVSKIQLAHVASTQGTLAVEHMNGKKLSASDKIIPYGIYTHPEVAIIGETKEEAIAKGYDVMVSKHVMYQNPMVKIHEDDRSYIKLILDKKRNVLLGGEIICHRATDMLGMLALAIGSEINVEDILKVMSAHPTYYESISETLHRNTIVT